MINEIVGCAYPTPKADFRRSSYMVSNRFAMQDKSSQASNSYKVNDNTKMSKTRSLVTNRVFSLTSNHDLNLENPFIRIIFIMPTD